jgi:cellulose synthase/poly-beta-1,6-N-acetylglucosamine synthase-like glycosyltransferase
VNAVAEMAVLGLLLVIALPTALSCVYLGIATLLSARIEAPRPSSRQLYFDIIVPAHNEAAVIARCIASLRKLDWPVDRFRVVVVAHNCNDSTPAIACAAGARVLHRRDPSRRGKGHALQFAFQSSCREQWADAVVVVDADSEVSGNLLEAFAARIEGGAHAIQAHYGVLNPSVTSRTRLMAIAQAAFHIARSRARERLKVSCGIRGNGWCVTCVLLRQVSYEAFSLAEDIEYGIDLGLSGYRVHYAGEASVLAEAVSSAGNARLQRQRWEGGRLALLRTRTWRLLRAAARHRSAICFDLALDLLVPPLSQIALMVATLTAGAALAFLWNPRPVVLLALALACGGVLLLYVVRGWQLSGTGARGLADLAHAPAFVLWKVMVVLRRRKSREWVRTERKRS